LVPNAKGKVKKGRLKIGAYAEAGSGVSSRIHPSSFVLWNFEFHHPFGSERGGNDG
jgi:hypothetical protein